jgi:diaminopimelate epimerase
MALNFTKMHGIGNDYVLTDAFTTPRLASSARLATLARRISDRHTGVGADGLILVCRPTAHGARAGAHARMRMFNADGTEAEMCGNGIRLVAKFAFDQLRLRVMPLRVETGAGVLPIEYTTSNGRLTTATVDMGEPQLDPRRVPADLSNPAPSLAKASRRDVIARTEHPFISLMRSEIGWLSTTFVGMGNPHAVIFVDRPPIASSIAKLPLNLDELDLARLGPSLERHDAFPHRANIHFARSLSPSRVQMRTWERGSGITLACGTGACAVVVAGVLTGVLRRAARVDLPGGTLRIRWDPDTNHISMTGPATEVYRGTWPG